ncbi:MAG: hypothetical protein IBX41_05030 [Methanophagales archaeon]|nr:hypothetical protein [Methanophagales archaeon]
MSEESINVNLWRRVNWPGIIAGILTIMLPFLGSWWLFRLGTEAMIMAVSPFGIDVSIFDETMIVSPLVWWLILGLKLGVVYLGVLLLTGSILSVSNRSATIADIFVRFSARKLLWLVVAFVATLLSLSVLVNQLPGMLGLPFQLQVPYLIGRSSFSIGIEGMQLTAPIFMGFTQAFALAVIAAALGIAAWIYQKRCYQKEQ